LNTADVVAELGRLESGEAGEALRQWLRRKVQDMFSDVLAQEVLSLCGPSYQRTEQVREYHRAGHAPGCVQWEGMRTDIQRPRVRRKKESGETEEVPLKTYQAAQDKSELKRQILTALACGVSGREQKRLHPDAGRGTSKSAVSRWWIEASQKQVDEFRSRNIQRGDWLVLMLDGLALSSELVAVVGLGIAVDGTKHLLDFELGATENAEVAKALLERLTQRGFQPAKDCRLLCVEDGSKALRSALQSYWPDAVIQRCLVHKERNLRGYLSRRNWGELARLMKRLRQVEGAEAGREALADLERFLAGKNAAALESLREAGESLIALHTLNVPATLHVNLLSTNAIENPFLNVRRKINRVTRWRAETDQANRWLAYGLLEAERGFRRISGHAQLPKLQEALRRPIGTLKV
jgi:transposase-like protein